MRQILFKAKRVDNGEWVQGNLFVEGNRAEITRGTCNGVGIEGVSVDKDTICQYTGLTDKNGNKIWENDVVKKHFYTDYDAYANSEEYVGIVKFTDCAWVIDTKKNERVCTRPIFESMAYSKDLDYFEVIGNIFDNEDLLKGE